MSFYSKIDIILNLNSFKNIDILQSGYYYLKTSLHYLDSAGEVFIFIRNTMQSHIANKKIKMVKSQNIFKNVK